MADLALPAPATSSCVLLPLLALLRTRWLLTSPQSHQAAPALQPEPTAVLPLSARKSLPAPSSPTPPRDYGSLCPSLFLHWNVLGRWSSHSVYMVLLAHCRRSTDMMPTNDWPNLLTPGPSPVPFPLFSPATQTSSQSFKQIPATGPLCVLLPGTSSLSFSLHDNVCSS